MKKILKAFLPLSVVATSVPAIAATSCGQNDTKTLTLAVRPEQIQYYKPIINTFESITGWKVKLSATTNAVSDYSDWKVNGNIPDVGYATNAHVWESQKLSQPIDWVETLKDKKYNLPGITYRIDLKEDLILSKYLLPVGTSAVGTIYDESRLIDKNGKIKGSDGYGPVCTVNQMTRYINGVPSGSGSEPGDETYNYAKTPNTPLSNVSADSDTTPDPKNWKIAREKMSLYHDNVAVVAKNCFAPRGTKMPDGSIIEAPWIADPRLEYIYADAIEQALPNNKHAIKNHLLDDSVFTYSNLKNPKTSAWMYNHYFKYQSEGVFDFGARTQATSAGSAEFMGRGENGIISPAASWMLKFIASELTDDRKNNIDNIKTLATHLKPKGIDGLAIGPDITGEKKTMALKLLKFIINDQEGAKIVKFNFPHLNRQAFNIQELQLKFDADNATDPLEKWSASRALGLWDEDPNAKKYEGTEDYYGTSSINLSSGDKYNNIVEGMMNQINITKLWGKASPRSPKNPSVEMVKVDLATFQNAWNGWVDKVWVWEK